MSGGRGVGGDAPAPSSLAFVVPSSVPTALRGYPPVHWQVDTIWDAWDAGWPGQFRVSSLAPPGPDVCKPSPINSGRSRHRVEPEVFIFLRLFAWSMARFPEAERRRLHKMICMSILPRSPTLGLKDQHLLAFGRG